MLVRYHITVTQYLRSFWDQITSFQGTAAVVFILGVFVREKCVRGLIGRNFLESNDSLCSKVLQNRTYLHWVLYTSQTVLRNRGWKNLLLLGAMQMFTIPKTREKIVVCSSECSETLYFDDYSFSLLVWNLTSQWQCSEPLVNTCTRIFLEI